MSAQSIETLNAREIRGRFAELPDVLTPRDLIAFLPIGRNAVYDALKRQEIKSVRVGQKLLITKAALREFLGGNVE
jgi:excisionase family DNA binding protein